ncbi:hypothetical protein [Aneurinibacillus terranovensis]
MTHRNLYANVEQAKSVIDLTSKDKIMNAMPIFNAAGLNPLMGLNP